MKAYMVEITTHTVVMADDEAHAYVVAERYKRDAFHDDQNPRIEIEGEVAHVEQLDHGWDGECIPYGGDGNTRLSALLTANAELTGAPLGAPGARRPFARPVALRVRPHGCACDFRTYMVGDGCAACNPEKALEFLRDTVDDQADEIDRLRAALKQCADAIEWSEGRRPHNLSTIGRAYWLARRLSAA